MVVEVAVDGGGPGRDVGVARLEMGDPLRGCKQADEAEVVGAARLQEGDGRCRMVSLRSPESTLRRTELALRSQFD